MGFRPKSKSNSSFFSKNEAVEIVNQYTYLVVPVVSKKTNIFSCPKRKTSKHCYTKNMQRDRVATSIIEGVPIQNYCWSFPSFSMAAKCGSLGAPKQKSTLTKSPKTSSSRHMG